MLSALLALDDCGNGHFVSKTHQYNFRKTLFGGQVLGQALMAAGLTVDDITQRPVHSLHAYFLKPGRGDTDIEYRVETTLDGRSISNRSVVAQQSGETILTASVSFHRREPGYEHQYPAAEAVTLKPAMSAQACQDKQTPQVAEFMGESPVTVIPCQAQAFSDQGQRDASAGFWLKSLEPLPDWPLLHHCGLAFASDIGLLATALMPHPSSLFSERIFAASIDHSMWFHRSLDLNNWHYYHTQSPWAGNARGLCRGEVYTDGGIRLADVAQEGLIRSSAP